ncbi:MAG TPA: ABC transporter permease [Actinomycetes bacterium]|nr:ABC transporter permease [Actinomycetes bacterium]
MTRVLARRARAHSLLPVTAVMTVLLAATGLATLLTYSAVVPQQGLVRLLGSDTARAAVFVDAALGQDFAARDEIVREAVGHRLGAVPTRVDVAGQSAPYRLPPEVGAPGVLTSFWFLDDLAGQARLVSGRWPAPEPAGSPVEVALSQPAAQRMALEPGRRLSLTSATFAPAVDVVVTGVYEPVDPAGPVVRLDPTGGAGVTEGEFTSLGPLAVAPDVFMARFAASARVSWLAQPVLTGLDPAGLAPLQGDMAALRADLSAASVFNGAVQVRTGLDGLMTQALRSLVVSRSTLPVPLLLLAVLAFCAIAYVGSLLHERRRGQRDLLRARGASRSQLVTAALLEGLAIAGPPALVAPFLATGLLRWASNPLGIGDGAGLSVALSRGTWAWMVAVALAATLTLAAPALVPAGTGGRGRWRGRVRPGVERAGVDIALLLVAGAGYLQLRAAGSPFAAADLREVRADPVFVLAPVILLVAVALLGLRLLPVLARLAGHLAGAGRSASPALGAWPVARRPRRYATSLLLLVLALSVGLMSAVATASGQRSRADQANHQVGSDVRVELETTRAADQDGVARLATLPGVAATLPAAREQVDTGPGPDTTLLALDAGQASDVMLLRADLLDRPTEDAFAAMRAPLDEAAVALPDDARALRGQVSLTVVAGADEQPDALLAGSVSIVVRDRADLVHVVPWAEPSNDGAPTRVTAALPAGSTALLGFVFGYTVPPRLIAQGPSDGHASVRISGLELDDGRPVRMGTTEWSTAVDHSGARSWAPVQVSAGDALEVAFGIGQPSAQVPVLAGAPEQLDRPITLTAIGSQQLLRSHDVAVGDLVGARIRGVTTQVRLAAAAVDVPTVSSSEALVVDLPTVQRLLLRESGRTIAPSEAWLRAEPGQTQAVAAAIRDQPGAAVAVVDRESVRAALDEDPLSVAFQGALRIALVGGVLFAVVGFVVSALLSVDERRDELAVLRALGMRPSDLSKTMLVEQALVLGLGTVLGLVVGLVVSLLVVPLTTVSSRTGAVMPPISLQVPWVQAATLAMALAAVMLVVVVGGVTTLVRGRLGPTLRTRQAP